MIWSCLHKCSKRHSITVLTFAHAHVVNGYGLQVEPLFTNSERREFIITAYFMSN